MVLVIKRWDYQDVLLSYLVCLLGSFTAVLLMEERRHSQNGLRQFLLLFTTTFALGGVAIWTLHQVSLLALHLTSPDGQPLAIDYDSRLLYGSLGIALVFVYMGLEISRYDKYFGMSRQQGVALLMQDLRRPGGLGLGTGGKTQVEWQVLFSDLYMITLGAFCTSGGLLSMHYMGMVSIVVEKTEMDFNPGIVFVSVVLAFVASWAAYWILFRVLQWRQKEETLRLTSAGLISVAICAVHYTGISAARFHYIPSKHHNIPEGSLIHSESKAQMVNIAIGISCAFCMICLYWVSHHHRVEVSATRDEIDKLSMLFYKLNAFNSQPTTMAYQNKLDAFMGKCGNFLNKYNKTIQHHDEAFEKMTSYINSTIAVHSEAIGIGGGKRGGGKVAKSSGPAAATSSSSIKTKPQDLSTVMNKIVRNVTTNKVLTIDSNGSGTEVDKSHTSSSSGKTRPEGTGNMPRGRGFLGDLQEGDEEDEEDSEEDNRGGSNSNGKHSPPFPASNPAAGNSMRRSLVNFGSNKKDNESDFMHTGILDRDLGSGGGFVPYEFPPSKPYKAPLPEPEFGSYASWGEDLDSSFSVGPPLTGGGSSDRRGSFSNESEGGRAGSNSPRKSAPNSTEGEHSGSGGGGGLGKVVSAIGGTGVQPPLNLVHIKRFTSPAAPSAPGLSAIAEEERMSSIGGYGDSSSRLGTSRTDLSGMQDGDMIVRIYQLGTGLAKVVSCIIKDGQEVEESNNVVRLDSSNLNGSLDQQKEGDQDRSKQSGSNQDASVAYRLFSKMDSTDGEHELEAAGKDGTAPPASPFTQTLDLEKVVEDVTEDYWEVKNPFLSNLMGLLVKPQQGGAGGEGAGGGEGNRSAMEDKRKNNRASASSSSPVGGGNENAAVDGADGGRLPQLLCHQSRTKSGAPNFLKNAFGRRTSNLPRKPSDPHSDSDEKGGGEGSDIV